MTDAKRHDRRGILGAAAAAAGFFAGGALRPRDAAAANGSGLLAGQRDNTASSTTELTTAGPQIVNDGALVVTGANADYGIVGSGTNVGLFGKGTIGIFGEGTVGGVFSGTAAAISLTPRGAAGAPTADSLMGDVAIDSNGVLWLCTSSGNPGTWSPLSGGSTQFLQSPQRLFDSRNPGTGGRFPGGSTRTIGVTSALIGVPGNARAIVANLTVTETDDLGFLTAYPAGVARPITSNVNWAAFQTVANSATIKLGDGGQISLYVERSGAQVIVDVAGYVI